MIVDISSLNILVTGASRGIGYAIAKILLENKAKVALHYNKNNKNIIELLKKYPDYKGELFKADISETAQAISLFENVEKKFGHIDVVINNAGIAINSPINKRNEEWIHDWNLTMNVNLTALAVICKLAVNHFSKNGGGRIINIASRASFRGDTPEYLSYAASKGGIVSLTRSIARGFGKQNIKAFIIAPGFVKTDMAKSFMDEYGENIALDDIALPKLTEPADIAPFILFLASGLADHATGGTFDINAASYVH
jgi:NAD(P)-dependent dehydrogenase (short-subunit alcohol dehydrogenase family)